MTFEADNGTPYYRHLGRASSFAKTTEDKDARPIPCPFGYDTFS